MKRCLNCMEEYDESRVRCPGCNYSEEEDYGDDSVLRAGSILQGRYIVGTCRKIREFDMTYIGWDALFERRVLIQEFFPKNCVVRTDRTNLAVKSEQNELYNEGLSDFVNYYRNLIRLYKERDILSVYSCFKADGTAYATLEYSAAVTLSEWMKATAKVDEGEVMYVLYQAVEAVKKLHNLGVIHGDITMDSFFVTATGGLVLKDFAQPRYYCGLPQSENWEAGAWIDVYGLSMLFGKMLLLRENVSQNEVLKALKSEEFSFSKKAIAAIEEGLQTEPGKRINSLDKFCDDLFGDTVTMRQINRKEAAKEKKPGIRRRLLYGGLGLAVLVCSVVGFVIYGKGKGKMYFLSGAESTVDMTEEDKGPESASAETVPSPEQATPGDASKAQN